MWYNKSKDFICEGVKQLARSESMEDYLETILLLGKKLPVVRGVDIANEMNFKKSSVSVAMKKMRDLKLITVTEQGYIYLTDAGKAMAEDIYERHTVIAQVLMELGVEESVALEDACRIEHALSMDSFEAIKKHRIEKTSQQ